MNPLRIAHCIVALYRQGTWYIPYNCAQVASTVDMFPTIVNLVGGKMPGVTMDGVDMAPILFNNEKVWRHAQACHLYTICELVSAYVLLAGASNNNMVLVCMQSKRDYYIYYPSNPDPKLGIFAVRWHQYKAHYYSYGWAIIYYWLLY